MNTGAVGRLSADEDMMATLMRLPWSVLPWFYIKWKLLHRSHKSTEIPAVPEDKTNTERSHCWAGVDVTGSPGSRLKL